MLSISTAQRIPEKRPDFWQRQFAVVPTRAQDNFDIAFGVVLPVLCFAFDPIVFKNGFFGAGGPLLAKYQLFTYLFSGIEILALAVWLSCRNHLRSFSGPISGVLLIGGLFSWAIGILILPYTLIGLLLIIGVAGFTPFLTGLVYLRNGVRGLRSQERNSAFESRYLVAGATATMALALPIFVSMQVSKIISTSIDDLVNGNVQQATVAIDRLKWLRFVPKGNLRGLVFAYAVETDPAKKDLLKQAYKDLTGEDIEYRLMILSD